VTQELTADELLADRQRLTNGDRSRLEWAGYKVHSQSDEDGILDEIFQRIGVTNRTFVEFGAETGNENNSRLLLDQGWNGLWIEGLAEYSGSIKWQFREQIASGQLKLVEAFVNRDNINSLISGAGINGEIDFLSVDIDGNDYHVFEAINAVNARVVCLEYNPFKPAGWVMPYDPSYRWAHDFEYGATASALTDLAANKGYVLVGSGMYSANIFFVRSELIGRKFASGDVDNLVNPFDYQKLLAFPRSPVPQRPSKIRSLWKQYAYRASANTMAVN
jgi:hypothetical protein